MFRFPKKHNRTVDEIYLDRKDVDILLYVYNKLKLESVASLTIQHLNRSVYLDSPVLVNIKVTRLVLDGYLRKSGDTKDIRFTYVNITNLGIETLKKLRVIDAVIKV